MVGRVGGGAIGLDVGDRTGGLDAGAFGEDGVDSSTTFPPQPATRNSVTMDRARRTGMSQCTTPDAPAPRLAPLAPGARPKRQRLAEELGRWPFLDFLASTDRMRGAGHAPPWRIQTSNVGA